MSTCGNACFETYDKTCKSITDCDYDIAVINLAAYQTVKKLCKAFYVCSVNFEADKVNDIINEFTIMAIKGIGYKAVINQ